MMHFPKMKLLKNLIWNNTELFFQQQKLNTALTEMLKYFQLKWIWRV
jgi:hypothetical protein